MKRIFFFILAAGFWLGSLNFPVFAQQDASGAGWMRVASDKGEFAVDFPARHGFFADNDGFLVTPFSTLGGDLEVRGVRLLSAYHENTHLSIESYLGGGAVLEALRGRETRGAREAELKTNGVKLRQYVTSEKGVYMERRYFNVKDRVYILTAATRGAGETPAAKRFFDSLRLAPDGKPLANESDAVPFPNLKQGAVAFDRASSDALKKTETKTEAAKDLIIVAKPRATYTDVARQQAATGVVVMLVTFSKHGWISRIELVGGAGPELTRQSLFAALRIKFLPPADPNAPETITKKMEYSFEIR